MRLLEVRGRNHEAMMKNENAARLIHSAFLIWYLWFEYLSQTSLLVARITIFRAVRESVALLALASGVPHWRVVRNQVSDR